MITTIDICVTTISYTFQCVDIQMCNFVFRSATSGKIWRQVHILGRRDGGSPMYRSGACSRAWPSCGTPSLWASGPTPFRLWVLFLTAGICEIPDVSFSILWGEKVFWEELGETPTLWNGSMSLGLRRSKNGECGVPAMPLNHWKC